jgi:membrane protein YqaA with SNARE-associated domain
VTAYLALFAWSFLAATILPLASEPMLVILVRTRGEIGPPVLIATAGNYLGACTTYLLARAAARVTPLSKTVARHARAVALVERFGQPALLLSWVPIVGDAIVAVAGAVGMRFVPFSLWVFAGKLARYATVAWLAKSALG